MQDKIDRFIKAKAAQQQQAEKIIEREEEWKHAINRLAETADGILFIRYLIKVSGLFSPKPIADHIKMVEERTLCNLYLELVRKYLTEESIRRIER